MTKTRRFAKLASCLHATILCIACAGDSSFTTTPPPASFIVTEAQFRQMFPNPIAFYAYADMVTAINAFPGFAQSGSETIRKQEAAAFLANVAHETLYLQYIREIDQANWPRYCDKENIQYPCAPNQQYYGRGPIQISWNFNYGAAGEALGVDLLADPDRVARDATVAWKTALWYWMTQRGQGRTTPHETMVTSAGFGETIRAINGGIECQASGLGHAQMNARLDYYRRFTQRLGVAVGGGRLTC